MRKEGGWVHEQANNVVTTCQVENSLLLNVVDKFIEQSERL
jgi:hypothetical protein